MKIPSDEEAKYLRLLSQGMLPHTDIPMMVRKSLRVKGWASAVGRRGYTVYWAMNWTGSDALIRYDEQCAEVVGDGGGSSADR